VELETIKKAYRRYAPAYDILFGALLQPGRRAVVQRMRCRSGERILEVGVGTGLSLLLYPSDVRVTGIDISPEMLARARLRRARQRLKNVALHCMDAERTSFADNSFDKVVAMHVASVVPDPVRLANEMQRVCRPGGEIYIVNHFMLGDLPMNGPKRFMGRFSRELGFRMDFSLDEFIRESRIEVLERIPVNLFGLWTLLRVSNRKSAGPESRQGAMLATNAA
jgi:phosphatidylethanolamine/phosphatidyl-N-methylethanolamine N-methyltransferase